MVTTGFVKINRLKKEPDVVKGVFDFVSEKTKTVEKIGFHMKANDKTYKKLVEFMNEKEIIEITGKLFKEDKMIYINVLDLKLCRTKYDLFNEGHDGLGI